MPGPRKTVRPSSLKDPYFSGPQLKVFVEQLATAYPPILGALHEAWQAFNDALTKVLRESVSPTSALNDAQARAVASVGTS